jgi:hypothetical protein
MTWDPPQFSDEIDLPLPEGFADMIRDSRPDRSSTPRHSCGYEEDSFACKIRHLQINTGVAKAADDA